jgi:superkiller protein 3
MWVDLLTVHTLKNDIFSAKTLIAIHEGVQKLNDAVEVPGSTIKLTNYHRSLFERLQRSFNNPVLLKEIGVAYLDEFGMPGVALKHFDLARHFAPKDRDLEQFQKEAALAMARQMADPPGHSGLGQIEPLHGKGEVNALLRKTGRLDRVQTRENLGEATGELEQKQEARRKTGHLPEAAQFGKSFDSALELAEKLIGQTEFTGAAAALEEARQAGAPNEELQMRYAQLGLSAFDYGRMEEALAYFVIMRDLGPEAVEGWFNCGLVYQKMGNLKEALASYNEAVRLAPENPKTWCNLGSVLFERGDYVEAEEAARKALLLREEYARAWDNLASALGAQNRLPEALEACQHAIRIQPGLHSAWFKFGVINFQLEDLVKATEAFNLTGDNPSYFAYVLYYMSMIAARRGEFDQSLQKLAQARAVDSTNELEIAALDELGAACSKIGRYSTAADFFTQITVKHPDNFSAWLSLGTALHRGEQLEHACQAYKQAAALQPENSIPWHNLGLLASDQGNAEESCACFQREVEMAPHDAKAWYDLGVSLQTLGRQEESAEAFERAESLVKSMSRISSDLSAALSIVRRLNLGDRVLKTEPRNFRGPKIF